MSNAVFQVPKPYNEEVRSYAPGSPERASLQARLKTMSAEKVELPLVIGGECIATGDTGSMRMPHDHQHVLGTFHKASQEHVGRAVEAARQAHQPVVLGAVAQQLYQAMSLRGEGGKDFSAIINGYRKPE